MGMTGWAAQRSCASNRVGGGTAHVRVFPSWAMLDDDGDTDDDDCFGAPLGWDSGRLGDSGQAYLHAAGIGFAVPEDWTERLEALGPEPC